MTLQGIISFSGLILAFINLLLVGFLRDTSNRISKGIFYVVMLYIITLPFTIHYDLQKQIPAGTYSIPCKVTIEEKNYYNGKATAVIKVDEYDEIWISDLKGIENSGLHFEDDSVRDITFSQTEIFTDLIDSSYDNRYKTKIGINEIKASRLGVSLSERIATTSIFEKLLYSLMIIVALLNIVNLFRSRTIDE